MKKSLAFTLTMSLAVTIFAGCSTDDSESTGTRSDSSTQMATEVVETSESNDPTVEKEKAVSVNADSMYTEISYGSESESQKLDIYIPENEEGPFPVIIAVHGINVPEKDIINDTWLEHTNEGYAVVQVPSGSTGKEAMPEVTNETKKAIQYIEANADEYNLDVDNMEVWGYSATGQAEKELDIPNKENEVKEEDKTEDFKYVPITY